jgi:PAN domain
VLAFVSTLAAVAENARIIRRWEAWKTIGPIRSGRHHDLDLGSARALSLQTASTERARPGDMGAGGMPHAFLLAMGVLVVLVSTAPARAQVGFDRPGGDYANFAVRSGDPAICALRCERDLRCAAWSFSYPRTVATIAICWLKNRVVPRVEDACCMSSVKGAGVMEPRTGPIEYSIDRVGGDYRNFETPPETTGKACLEACQAEARCRAWTYLRPGYESTTARCFLKDRLTRPRHKPCCVSGVVR